MKNLKMLGLVLVSAALGFALGILVPRTGSEMAIAKAAPNVEKPQPEDSDRSAPRAKEPAETEMKVLGVKFRNDVIEVALSGRPDMSHIRTYVNAGPLRKGSTSISYGPRSYWDDECILKITGDFAFRTNLTLTIKKGLPLEGAAGTDKKPLAADFVRSFTRPDLRPSVGFAAKGRYLPPCGRRTIALETINTTSVVARLHRVVPANVVQLLAREEAKYDSYWRSCVDSSETKELSGEPYEVKLPLVPQPNEKTAAELPISMDDHGPDKGIFLAEVGCAERQNDSPRAYRVVCVSDLGLSVRKLSDDSLGVWTTSFTTGRPVAGARVEVYSSANLKIMEGVADGLGWCRTRRIAPGEPFVVVVRTARGDDSTFIALSIRMKVDETMKVGARNHYLAAGNVNGFIWTERGIYRHDEKIFLHLLLRDGKGVAPKPFPVELALLKPGGNVFSRMTLMPDANGSIVTEAFSVPAEQPSGTWTIRAATPGKKGDVFTLTNIRIEEFVPPHIRVAVEPAKGVSPEAFAFEVSAEYLFGGAAAGLKCEGAVMFADAPFTPAGWKDYAFGNASLGLKPAFARLAATPLDADGRASFIAPMAAEKGRPKARVKAIAQGTVLEDGGRPVSMRASAILDFYPYYLGAKLPNALQITPGGECEIPVVCVATNEQLLVEKRDLVVRLDRKDTIYSYREKANGWNSWDCETLMTPVLENLRLSVTGEATLRLPIRESGDYYLTITDPERGVSFSGAFYASTWEVDEEVRAPLSDPGSVEIMTDREYYRVGATPRLVVKSPFAGTALLTVLRDTERETRVLTLTNATSEVVLKPVTADDAPNLNVFISVVESVSANAKHLAVRAHGEATILVRPIEREIPLDVKATRSGNCLKVQVGVAPTSSLAFPDAMAVVTVVDEAVMGLTNEPMPDPCGRFAEPCMGNLPLYDLYGYVLPVNGLAPRAGGVKTGGDEGAELLGRMSPVGTRRFKPLALWRTAIPLASGRTGEATFQLPEFAGEVRVTAVGYTSRAAGSASTKLKISPKLVMMPDAPRFVAPGDVFEVTMPVHNRADAAGEVAYRISNGAKLVAEGSLMLAKGARTNLHARVTALAEPGEMRLDYETRGLGETHRDTILLPVRPAVAWVERCGVSPESEWTPPKEGRFTMRSFDSPLGEYAAALNWLAEYRHGCLEQTISRVFPLIAAGGLFNAVVTNQPGAVELGVNRVVAMMRADDFVMWPDCTYAPWDREVSIYAAEFLVEASKAGVEIDSRKVDQIRRYLGKWTYDRDSLDLSAYAAFVQARMGDANEDRLLFLYGKRSELSALGRARLSLAFSAIRDRTRAVELMQDSFEPQSVKEAAFAVLALLEAKPDDARILPFVTWLNARRDRSRASWGTTEENAHALRAIGAYYHVHPAKPGEKFVAWRTLTLPKLEAVKDDESGISIARQFLGVDGQPVDLENLKCGELLTVELTITSPVKRVVNDLVIEDLLAGAFDPVLASGEGDKWVMRSDIRDDRVLVFSKRFELEAGKGETFRYQVRVVSAGDYVLPGPSVEGMYNPELHARRAPRRLVVRP